MKRSTKIILASVLSIGIIGTVAAGRYGGCQRFAHDGFSGHRGEHMMEHMSERFNLDEAQQAKLETVMTQVSEMRESMIEDREQKRQFMLELIEAPNFDREKALAVVKEKMTTLDTHAPQIIASIADLSDSLTAEQKAEVKEMMERRFSHRWH